MDGVDDGFRSKIRREISDFRSATDNDVYPDFALAAALSSEVFATFRQSAVYVETLEHVSHAQGRQYWEVIKDEYGLTAGQAVDIIEPLQEVGQPFKYVIDGFPVPISMTALRYLKTALDIRQLYGSRIDHVVEIGCGFGGLAVILDRVVSLHSYTFVDLWQVNLLIQRFIEQSPFSAKYRLATIRQLVPPGEKWDLAISNYAFSEMPEDLQQLAVGNILDQAIHGYLTMNSGRDGQFVSIKNLCQEALLSRLAGSRVAEEHPRTGEQNYMLLW